LTVDSKYNDVTFTLQQGNALHLWWECPYVVNLFWD